MLSPKRFSEAETGAINPWALSAGINIFPRPVLFRSEEQDSIKAAQVGIRGQQLLHLVTQAPRGAPVVVVPVSDELTSRLSAGKVTFFPQNNSILEAEVADRGMVGEFVVDRIGAVVQDKQLTFWIILTKKILDRHRYEKSAVAGRHDATDKRQRG